MKISVDSVMTLISVTFAYIFFPFPSLLAVLLNLNIKNWVEQNILYLHKKLPRLSKDPLMSLLL